MVSDDRCARQANASAAPARFRLPFVSFTENSTSKQELASRWSLSFGALLDREGCSSRIVDDLRDIISDDLSRSL